MAVSPDTTLHTPHDICTGCSACHQACPSGAITMEMDAEGFIRPVVDAQKCIHCGLCNKVCPVADDKVTKTPSDFIAAYAAWNSNLAELKLSSSGGIFSLLADRTLQRKGIVCGAVYDNTGHVHHGFAQTAEELSRMRGSKYVQSDMQNSFSQVRDFLKSGREVLFTGTGCQVGGLKSFLRKDYPNLLTQEIICEGTPSPGLWERHLHYLCPNMKELHYLSFRDKKYGWTKTLVADYTNKEGKRSKIAIPAAREPYIKVMFGAISQARNCYACRFREGRSGADIIVGDMWALNVVAPEAKPQCGASVILCNTERGKLVVEELKSRMGYCKQISPLSAAINNGYIYRAPVIEAAARRTFYQRYQDGVQLHEYVEEALQRSNRVAILNHAGHSNYGSNLTAFALQEALRRMGYDARTVSLVPFHATSSAAAKPYHSFINGVLRRTKEVFGPCTCSALNKEFDTFVVGSDQVWRYPRSARRQAAEPAFYLDFAAQGKRRIAYAASFGIGEYQGPSRQRSRLKKALKDFDAVSVREEQAVITLQQQFDYQHAEVTLDPVFLLTQRDWQRFSQAADSPAPEGTLSSLFFFYGSQLRETLATYAQQHHLTELSLNDGGASVMTWLRRIEKAALVVTDSFHTLCFAIIFKRPFVVITSERCGKARLHHLLNLLGLTERIIDMDNVSEQNLTQTLELIADTPIDYDSISDILENEAERSLAWLKEAMQKTPTRKNTVKTGGRLGAMLEKLIFRVREKLDNRKINIKALIRKHIHLSN